MQVRRGADLQSSEGETEVSAPDEPKVRRIGPEAPDNDLVICPVCTSQFTAICVNDQHRITDLLDAIDTLRSRLEAVQRAAYGMTEALRIIGGGFIPGDFSLDPSDFHERMWVWGQRTAKEAIAAYHAATSAEKEVGK